MRLVALLVLLAAPGVAADADPAPECPVYSIEGVRLGMSLGEAQAAATEWKWRKPTKEGVAIAFPPGSGALKALGWMEVHLRDGRVMRVVRDYGRKLTPALSAGVVLAFEQRYAQGAEVSHGTGTYYPNSVAKVTRWTLDACKAGAWIEEGTAFVSVTGYVAEHPVLVGGVVDLSVVGADISEGAAKVKF